MKTGGGGEDKIIDSTNPEVEGLIGKPHIVEWSNCNDSDSVVINNLITNEIPILIQSNTMEIFDCNNNIGDTFKENEEIMNAIDDNTPVVLDTQYPKTPNCSKTLKHKNEKKLFQGQKTAGIVKECEITLEHEKKMNHLQILNQKLIMQGLVANRLEEHQLFKLNCEKLALEIKQLKDRSVID